MINNINTLQNLPESSGLSTYTDIYLKQSLANLGQRFSAKGDGLSVGEFSICDILDIKYDENAHKNSYAYINISVDEEYGSDNYVISLSYIDNNDISTKKTIPLLGDLPYSTVENIESKGSPINGVDHYGSGGYIRKLDNEYRTAFAGYDYSGNIKEITIDSFLIDNSISSRLGSGLRFFSSYISGNSYKVRALACKLIDENKYSFTLYDTNYESLLYFKEFIYSSVIGDAKNLSTDDILDSLIENNILTVYSYQQNGSTYKLENVECDCEDTGTGAVTFNLYTDSLNNPTLENEVSNIAVMFSYDIAVFYNLISEYYNSKIYFIGDDNTALKKKILTKIVTKIFEDHNKEYIKFAKSKASSEVIVETDYTVNSLDIYLPLNYKFIYSCNSNNQAQIYNSVSDISVEYTLDLKGEMYKILQGEKSEQLMICSISDFLYIDNKFNVYSFSVTYSRENIVDDINVSNKFTLPYIDANGYWCINNIPTSVYARGKDGGQPNIIITYTDTTSSNKNTILSSFKKDELDNLNWEETKVRIRPLDDNDNAARSNYHIVKTMMPTSINDLNENLITMLEHAIILNISSVNSEIIDGNGEKSNAASSLKDGLGENAVIPTFWALNKVQDTEALNTENPQFKYEFAYVKQPGADWAIDMNYLSNAEGIVKHYMNFGIVPDNYEHSWVVFDRINTSFKNSANSRNITVWPVLKNNTRIDYAYIIGEPDGESVRYNNDLNLTFAFYDNITKQYNTGYITGVGQNNNTPKYFSLANDNKVKKIVHYSYYKHEYLPDTIITDESSNDPGNIIPMLDLSEIFVMNQSTFNRQNILSVDSSYTIYNAYIGTAYDSENKSILHIGSSNVNPNIGEKTLMSHEDKEHFTKMNQIDIDFDRIHLNGNVFTKGSSWSMYASEDGNNIAWHMTTPVGYIGDLLNLTDENQNQIADTLMYTKEVTVMPGFTLPGGDKVKDHKENISYLNLNYFFDKVAKVDEYKRDKCEFRGDFVQYLNNCYFLQLQTDILESSIFKGNEKDTQYLLTNPIEFSYAFTDDSDKKMKVTVREIVSNSSHPVMYTNGTLQ